MGSEQSRPKRTDTYEKLIKQAAHKYDVMIKKKLDFEDYGTKSSGKAANVAADAYLRTISKLDEYEIRHGLGTNMNRSNRRYGPTNYWRIVHGHFYDE